MVGREVVTTVFSRALNRPVMQSEVMMAQKRKPRRAPPGEGSSLVLSRETSLESGFDCSEFADNMFGVDAKADVELTLSVTCSSAGSILARCGVSLKRTSVAECKFEES